MHNTGLDRRRFHHLSSAALSGLVAGATLGCGTQQDNKAGGQASAGEKHLCRGLNDCKGQGVTGDNACRGQGQCATYEKHACAGENACKGQGGCGETVGLNECAGKGGCAVPLMQSAWKKVRARKESQWEAADKPYGEPPPKE